MSEQSPNAVRAAYRAAGRRARLDLHPRERELASERICAHLLSSSLWHAAHRVGLYFAQSDEVDVSSLFPAAFATNRVVHVPVVGRTGGMRFAHLHPETTLTRNRYGIWEPDAPRAWRAASELDLVITPLVAYDQSGNRIGMGAGYYDRCFSFLRHRKRWLHPKLVGAAFCCQHTDEIPAAAWDVPLFAVATERGLYRFRR